MLVPYLVTPITVYYVQLHVDDAILCIVDDVMILLYWDAFLTLHTRIYSMG